jgi:hypothetical protein
MTTGYRIYTNDFLGGPVDWSAPAATVTGLSWDSPELPAGAAADFRVVPYDTVTGYECRDGDSRALVGLDGGGNDLSLFPAPPAGLTVTAAAGGTATVAWLAGSGGNAPARFWNVYAGTPAPDYSVPAAGVPAVPGSGPGRHYRATVTGLAGGVTYRVGVRAVSAAGEEPNTTTAAVTGKTTGPAAVGGLAAAVVT